MNKKPVHITITYDLYVPTEENCNDMKFKLASELFKIDHSLQNDILNISISSCYDNNKRSDNSCSGMFNEEDKSLMSCCNNCSLYKPKYNRDPYIQMIQKLMDQVSCLIKDSINGWDVTSEVFESELSGEDNTYIIRYVAKKSYNRIEVSEYVEINTESDIENKIPDMIGHLLSRLVIRTLKIEEFPKKSKFGEE